MLLSFVAAGCGGGTSDPDGGGGVMDGATGTDAGGGGTDAGDTDAGDTDAGGVTDAGGGADAGADAGLGCPDLMVQDDGSGSSGGADSISSCVIVSPVSAARSGASTRSTAGIIDAKSSPGAIRRSMSITHVSGTTFTCVPP